MSELIEEVRRHVVEDVASGLCSNPSPPQRAWPVPDRSGAKLVGTLKGRCPSHGGHKQGEGPKRATNRKLLLMSRHAHIPGWESSAGMIGTSRCKAAGDGHGQADGQRTPPSPG